MIEQQIKFAYHRLRRLIRSEQTASLLLLGKELSWKVAALPLNSDFRQVGFSVFSQSDEDGIIQYLIKKIPIENESFIEFGVENYEQSNTRFLMLNDNWQGLVLDASPSHIRYIQSDQIYWQYDLQARCAWITRDNIDSLIREAGVSGDVGLLSIDLDGNDYWVWERIESISPRIVVVEYNSLFGLQPVSVPYQEGFSRTAAHFSNLYFGCSLAALSYLAKKKGYVLLGSNLWGNNAFFLRSDVAGRFCGIGSEKVYVLSKFRESRDANGRLTFTRGADRLKLIEHLPVVNVVTGQHGALSEFIRTGGSFTL